MLRYSAITVIKNHGGKRYYVNNIYPDIPVTESDIYIVPTAGDRLDLLANDYYKDPTLYWIIASANALPGDSLIPPVGIQLRIPANLQQIISDYELLNNLR